MKPIRYEKAARAVHSVLSIIFAFVAGGLILLFIGKNPLLLYGQLFVQGIGSSLGIIETIIKTAPLLIVSAGLLVAFSGGLWNLGVEGQFLIGAMLTGWLAPKLVPFLSLPVYFLTLGAAGFIGGMAWALIPALLKARYDFNEIIMTLMMNYVAFNFVTWMVKGPINDRSVVPAQTPLIPMTHRMPMIPFTRIHMGLIIGLILILAIHWVIRHTTIGYQIRVIFANKQAAIHGGMNVSNVIVWSLLISGGFAGLAGVSEVLAIKGLFQGGWNPMYGMTCIPLVFLARLNGCAVIPLACFFSFLAVGGEFVARDQSVPIYFIHLLEGLMLLFFAAGQYLEQRRTGRAAYA
ncbi:MAG: ABC transporter permease [Deltaproteobacteria bacterium]|nr:ABC transporter permease [Deltaproteobacteria bacterium]